MQRKYRTIFKERSAASMRQSYHSADFAFPVRGGQQCTYTGPTSAMAGLERTKATKRSWPFERAEITLRTLKSFCPH